jgi:hypothetical protein
MKIKKYLFSFFKELEEEEVLLFLHDFLLEYFEKLFEIHFGVRLKIKNEYVYLAHGVLADAEGVVQNFFEGVPLH